MAHAGILLRVGYTGTKPVLLVDECAAEGLWQWYAAGAW